jgi:Na+/H+ antiporter NhaD/arsenite permease-like protein
VGKRRTLSHHRQHPNDADTYTYNAAGVCRHRLLDQNLGLAIVFGANLGGSLTPIGSAANIITLGILKKQGKTISWGEWFRQFGPLVILQLLIATIYITILSMVL